MHQIYEYLYLSKFNDINENILQELGITCIINLSQIQFPKNINENYKILNIDINDTEDSNISKFFNKTNKFIVNNFMKGRKIVVFCLACISRSPTIIIAFLIKKRHMKYEDAYNFLKKIKKICPNEGFIEQLKNI